MKKSSDASVYDVLSIRISDGPCLCPLTGHPWQHWPHSCQQQYLLFCQMHHHVQLVLALLSAEQQLQEQMAVEPQMVVQMQEVVMQTQSLEACEQRG